MLGKLPLWWKSLVVVLVLMVSITFFVWRSLPDSSKEKMLEKILPQVLSRQETGQDKPTQVNAEPETLTETDTGFRGLSDTNEAHTVIRETGTSRFREPEMVEIPDKEFSIGKYEVTNLQYKQFLDDNPIWPKPTCWDDPRFNEDRKPVVGVSWFDAKGYCEWLANKVNEEYGLKVRYGLPTKEQWDTAAGYKGGSRFPWEVLLETQKEHANIGREHESPLRVDRPLAHTTMSGVVDTPGNVAEWCEDTHIEERKIVRGGGWSSEYSTASYMSQLSYPPDERKEFVGFRIVKLKQE